MHRSRGFTLVELAVVLAIVALLLGSMMMTFSARVEQQNRSDTQRRLDDARELLLAFAMVNARLPCPAASNSVGGDESITAVTGVCTGTGTANYTGFLPARTIGFQPVDGAGFATDAWGNRIRYAVSATTWLAGNARFTKAHVANSATAAWSVTQTPADLVVCSYSPATVTNTSCDADTSVTNVNTLVAIVFSTGKNGATGGTGLNEARNLDGNALFVNRPPDPTDFAGGEFDDMMVWIPVGVLYGRLIAAGVMP